MGAVTILGNEAEKRIRPVRSRPARSSQPDGEIDIHTAAQVFDGKRPDWGLDLTAEVAAEIGYDLDVDCPTTKTEDAR